MNLFLIAGEPSGDLLGARMMVSLKGQAGEKIRFSGIGGERMRAEGQEQIFPQDDLAVMGLAEVLPRIPRLLRRIRQAVQAILQQKPDVVVTIDAPDFSFRVARRVRKLAPDIPLVHCVAPTVWSWRPGRARKIARFLDHLLALFPFEPPYFTREGLACTFVGHPLVESGAAQGNAEAFRQRYPQTAGKRLLVVLPGSRRGEVTRLLPVLKDTLAKLKDRNLMAIVPTVERGAAQVEDAVRDWPVPALVVQGDRDKYDAFAAADMAVAASGTVVLELALGGLPAVIVYRINPLSAFLVRRLSRLKCVSLVNIMHDRMVMPELLQENCRADRIAEAAIHLLDSGEARAVQKQALAQVAGWLGQGGVQPPSARMADVILDLAGRQRKTT
ncbi:MAG: lipid-A-disaccharide synthase [Pseudomonadota bacterium]|nr:lipid-A-disaccharide synthase [Pseudomonadota bacterium]